MLFFVRAERREEEGGGREPLEGKRCVGVFFFSPFLWLSTVFLFSEWKCKLRNRVS